MSTSNILWLYNTTPWTMLITMNCNLLSDLLHQLNYFYFQTTDFPHPGRILCLVFKNWIFNKNCNTMIETYILFSFFVGLIFEKVCRLSLNRKYSILEQRDGYYDYFGYYNNISVVLVCTHYDKIKTKQPCFCSIRTNRIYILYLCIIYRVIHLEKINFSTSHIWFSAVLS